MRYLAIDCGQRRTGLAVGDDETRIATPLRVVESSSPQARLAAITRAATDEQADALVLGLPLNMDDTEGPPARDARAMARQLEAATGLPVHLVDERLSSHEADARLAGRGLTRDKKKQRRDAVAAAVILQTYWEVGGHGTADDASPDP
jgi:putative Holliday junction resolvase